MTMMRDRIARSMTMFFRFFADVFFRQRYGHRALVLETVAGVPGMIGGMLTHLKSLRRLQKGNGTKIHELLEEAENERKHLMFFMEVVEPSALERILIVAVQFIFWHYYLLMYLLFPRMAHLMTAHFEEEAVMSYTVYLAMIQNKQIQNPPAPQIAIDYYDLPQDATLYDMIMMVREDEKHHAEVNRRYSKR
jgi:ubiquinol oxidase